MTTGDYMKQWNPGAHATIKTIVNKAFASEEHHTMFLQRGWVPMMRAVDLAIVHFHIQPLQLKELAWSDDDEFFTEVMAIHENLDRTNLKFLNNFSPRFAANSHVL